MSVSVSPDTLKHYQEHPMQLAGRDLDRLVSELKEMDEYMDKENK